MQVGRDFAGPFFPGHRAPHVPVRVELIGNALQASRVRPRGTPEGDGQSLERLPALEE